MNLCSKNHDEVCFEGRVCPACELVTQLADLQQELARFDGQKD